MEKWEYLTRFIYAHHENQNAQESIGFYSREVGNFKPSIFSPQYMIGILNSLGEKGWEVVSMEPVRRVGKNGDIYYPEGNCSSDWSNSYFCVFKRRKQG